jgi:hypothetical protein
MTRKNPNARRATALTLLTSLLLVLAAESGALLTPTSAHAGTASTAGPGRRPLPGDPNTPDEGGRSTTLTSAKSASWILVWLKGIAHLTFIAR